MTSVMGLVARTLRSTWVSVDEPPAVAKYRIASLAVTVLPAPDSPDMTIDWSMFSLWHQNKVTIHHYNSLKILK